MTTSLNAMTMRVITTLVCSSLAACGGGGASTGSDSVTAALSVSNGTSAATSAAAVTTTDSTGTAASAVAVVTPVASYTAATSTSTTTATTATSTAAVTTSATTVSSTAGATTSTSAYGTYLRPYAVNSLWNSRPVNPVFGTFSVPTSSYFPTVAQGGYSTGVFLALATDQPVTLVGSSSTDTTIVGVADPDSGASHVVTIPRWPAEVIPAAGSDGHADIVDPVTNIIHSFWKLKQVNGRWTAALYSWSKLDGTGWGDPAHYYQGARAVGIPASAGLIRTSEINDGLPSFTHALAMSLTFNALSNGVNTPAYVFPATSADSSLGSNTGSIPEGALMMLPPSFDSSQILSADLKKIVETLKSYGAYVVDRNTGTPFVLYVENDSGYNLMPKGWDNSVAAQLDLIRAGLRQVISAQDYIDGNGKSAAAAIKAQQSMNILSLRGSWYKQSGTATATYDTIAQSLLFSSTTTRTVVSNANNTDLTPVKWAMPAAGTYVIFTVTATGGAKLRLQVKTTGGVSTDTGDIGDGQSVRILWPTNGGLNVIASSGTSGASSVKAQLVPAP